MKLKNASILIIDDDVDVLTALRMLLKPLVNTIVTEKNPNLILSQIEKQHFDIIILDMNFNGLVNTGNEGIFWLNKIKSAKPDIDVVLITAYGDIDLAIRSLKEGASDFMVKPWQNKKMIEGLTQLLEKKQSKRKTVSNPKADGTKIIGDSEAMTSIFLKLKKIAPTDANILILGENGTGKDLIAKAIHEQSLRKHKPFVKVDVGALTESLFESELFGYKKGAFTDAREDRKGRFEMADGGTLFLDEIGNISLHQQARLLTVLQNRHITPLGSNTPIAVDIRLICATNIPLSELADENRFRKDLLYRINTVDITMPPLRERPTDITLLAKHFITLYCEKYAKDPYTLSPEVIKKLKAHPFPGNVRELQYALERAVIMNDSEQLHPDSIVFSTIETAEMHAQPQDLKLDTVEKHTIEIALQKHKGNISKTAKELGITRAALYRRLEKYDL